MQFIVTHGCCVAPQNGRMRVMKRLTKGLFAVLLAFAFLSRGAVAFCPSKPADHGCCDKPAPAAPQTPCPEMACCRLVAATAAPALGRVNHLLAFRPPAPLLTRPVSVSFVVPIYSDSSPPGPPVQSSSSRSPPALLG